MAPTLMTDEDLDYIYVLVDVEGSTHREPKNIRQLTDAEFRKWIVEFSNYHGVQIIPSLGRMGMETRLAMINRLIRNGVKVYRQSPPDAGQRLQ